MKIGSKEKGIGALRSKSRSHALAIETGSEADKPTKIRISKTKTTELIEPENNSSSEDISVSKKRRNTKRQASAGQT